jgi:hypothetical protein
MKCVVFYCIADIPMYVTSCPFQLCLFVCFVAHYIVGVHTEQCALLYPVVLQPAAAAAYISGTES